jgi:hypothetical protein
VKKLILKSWPCFFFLALILASLFDVFYESAVEFDDKAFKELVVTKSVLREIEGLSIPIAENIPFLKSWANSYQENFQKIIHYLDISSLFILIQLTLLKLSHWWVFKFLLVVGFLAIFLPQLKSIAKSLLIIGLLISPGLAIYTHFLAGVTHELSLDLGQELKQQLSSTKEALDKKSSIHQAKLDSLMEQQKEKHGGEITLFDKIEDGVIKAENEVKGEFEKLGRELLDLLRFTGHHGLELSVALAGNIAVVFVVLPLGYFYFIGIVVNGLFRNELSLKRYNEKVQGYKSPTDSENPKQ